MARSLCLPVAREGSGICLYDQVPTGHSSMSHLSQREAASQWRMSRATLQRAIKAGKISLTTDRTIDPAEILRVFCEPSRLMSRPTVPDEPTPERHRMASLERENALLQQTIAAQAGTIAALEQANRLLTHDRPPELRRRRLWPWSKG
jgi:hypothetical protein